MKKLLFLITLCFACIAGGKIVSVLQYNLSHEQTLKETAKQERAGLWQYDWFYEWAQ